MGLFKSKLSQGMGEDTKLNMHSANVHDPILSAVNERQPFEAAGDSNVTAGNRLSYQQMATEGSMRDVFGAPIQAPDISNPTRARNERPMDTIRGFEYAISGDTGMREQLETPRLGWGFHEDYPQLNYGQDDSQYDRAPVANFNNYGGEQAVYTAPVLNTDEGKKKKKRGLFGKKK
ncbi:hypothetical protein BABINDRAFT_159389 [Babjeviella inositovora NRRL Y-12698]|uniref:Uncharacterized protein n=1 Tax=Babjeviella inositovora NRRL Y-12698 TaxID=984486 RepID=A0A1E3QZ30_9ASCO|nr:uncharacterized protein BABINDRAFT_159389 [Babjeviella inositovora NRRL Y-12698]ODQ82896.1 hypothetical protein BABINDRAFT_159389 [Babjeviella inositovora NRRL Y-12698]